MLLLLRCWSKRVNSGQFTWPREDVDDAIWAWRGQRNGGDYWSNWQLSWFAEALQEWNWRLNYSNRRSDLVRRLSMVMWRNWSSWWQLELTIDGQSVRAEVSFVATGSNHRKLGVPGEDELYGRGVHCCATCDGAFYRDKESNRCRWRKLSGTRGSVRRDTLVTVWSASSQ